MEQQVLPVTRGTFADDAEEAAERQLEQAIGAMLERGIVRFKPFSWCFGMVDMTVESEVFTDQVSVLSVNEDDWNGGPAKCVTKELARTISAGRLRFIPCTERT